MRISTQQTWNHSGWYTFQNDFNLLHTLIWSRCIETIGHEYRFLTVYGETIVEPRFLAGGCRACDRQKYRRIIDFTYFNAFSTGQYQRLQYL